MSRTNEDWTSEEFDLKNYRNLRRLTHNSEVIDEQFGKQFITYTANKYLPCYKYDLMHRQCVNENGYMTREYQTSKACQMSKQWLEQCVANNQTIGSFKKYNPHEFQANREAFPVYNLKDVIQLF